MTKPHLIIIFFSLFLAPQDISNDLERLTKLNPSYADLLGKMPNEMPNEPSNKDKSIDEDVEYNIFNNQEIKIFGHDYIKNTPKSISSTSDLPVSNVYILSPGDKLRVILTGSKKDSFRLTVGLDGTVLFPELGILNVSGDSFAEAKDKISELISNSYIGAEAFVSLDELAAKKVNIIGAIKNPGTYIVNPFSTVFSVLAYSGGFEEYASLRNIILQRGDKEFNYDFYDLLIYGKNIDANIQQGDTIVVKSTTNLVEIEGEVRRPFIYEFKQKDTFKKLINDFAMGGTDFANTKNIYVEALERDTLLNVNINLDQKIDDLNIQKINVPRNALVEDLDIEIIGKSVQQDLLPLSKYSKLSQVIDDLFFSDDLYPFYATLEQTSQNKLFKDKVSFSLIDPDTYDNVELTSNPKIRFFSRQDIEDIQEAYLEQIENPLEKDNKIIIDALEERITALESNYEVSNTGGLDEFYLFDREKQNKKEKEKERINEILTSISKKSFKNFFSYGKKRFLPIEGRVSVDLLVDFFGIKEDHEIKNSSVSLFDGQTLRNSNEKISSDNLVSIYVPLKNTRTAEVTINGLVKAPGTYNVPLGTTLDNLYKIAGGLAENADEDSIFFTRESIKQSEKLALESSRKLIKDTMISAAGSSASVGGTMSVGNASELVDILNITEGIEPVGRLTGNLSPNTLLSMSIIIENGDSVTVYPKRNLITIAGEVLQPITVAYQNHLQTEDYIQLSGGYTDFADKSNIYIISKDGTSRPFDRKFFQAEDTLLPGDTIVVPRDLQKISTLPLVSVSTRIISDIAFAAASLNSLRN